MNRDEFEAAILAFTIGAFSAVGFAAVVVIALRIAGQQ